MKRLTYILALFFAVNAYADTWYVSTGGSNGNSGVDSANAVMNYYALTISDGDSVLFMYGDKWLDEIIYIDNNIYLGAFGDSTEGKPIISVYLAMAYQSNASNVYQYYLAELNNSDDYVYLPYRDRGGWKRFRKRYCPMLDANGNHYEYVRYQTDGVYSTITDTGDGKTEFKCSSLAGTESNDFHNDAGGKVQVNAWWAEDFDVDDYNDADGKFNISNLISAGNGDTDSIRDVPGYTHKIFLYGHKNYLTSSYASNYEYAFTDGTLTHDGYIWVYSTTDISGESLYMSGSDSIVGIWNSTVTIENIEFHGGNKAAIMEYGSTVTTRNCTFKYSHIGRFSDDGKGMQSHGDTMMYIANMGIFDQHNDSLLVEDGYFYKIGQSEGGAGDGDVSFNAIWSRFPEPNGKVTIINNHIVGCGRNGIHIKGDGVSTNVEYLVTGNLIKEYVTYVQDAAGIYFSGSPGTTHDKIIKNNIVVDGQHANDAFHCRNTTNHSGIYLDTNQEGTEIDSNSVFDSYIGIKLNGTEDNFVRGNLVVNHTQSGSRFTDQNFGHFGTGTINCIFDHNVYMTNDGDAFGYAYVTDGTFDGKGTESDTNVFINTNRSTDLSINEVINYSDTPRSLPTWRTTSNWELLSEARFINHSSDSMYGIANWTDSEKTVDLYDLEMYGPDSTVYTNEITIQPNKGVGLIYKSGTQSNLNLLPYVIDEFYTEPTISTAKKTYLRFTEIKTLRGTNRKYYHRKE